nr:hypothetical protein [Tanacetum cinerariifolium]
MDQNVDFSGSDQFQTPQYPDVYPPSQEMNEEVFQAEIDLMNNDRPIFLNDDENHSDQNKESLENSSDEIATSNSNEEKEEPPQDSDIRHPIREECCVEVIAPILSTKEPEYSSSMGYEHSNTTLETESDEIIKSGVEKLVPILSENEVTLEDKRECDVPISENSPICDNHSDIFSDSNNDDDISVYDDFEDVKYVEASLSDPEIVSVEEENVVHQEEEEERLINAAKNDIFDDSSRDPFLEEADLFLAFDNSIPPGIENVADDSE